jgi:uncharacterized membrane protein (UPF0127 family)
MWRLAIGVVVLAGCASPAPQPAAPAESIIDTAPESTGADPTVPVTIDPDAVRPDGFDLVAARVTEPDGTECDLCLWLADTGDERRQGLMSVTDLGPANGMAFRYPDPHTGWFWMKNTPLPLSIAFFAPDGSYLDSFDMEPCVADPCFRYDTPDNFRVAVETTQGDLADFGIVPGSTLELIDTPCP